MQYDDVLSTTAIKVSLTFSAVGDRLRSFSGLVRFGLRIGGSSGFTSAPMDATDVLTLRRPVHLPRRISHSIYGHVEQVPTM
jgi:hypothetical protein